MGNRSGGAGMRVSGRRTSKGSPFVAGPLNDSRLTALKTEDGSATVHGSVPHSPTTPVPLHDRRMPNLADDLDIARRRSSGGSTVMPNGPSALNLSNEPSKEAEPVDPVSGFPPLPAGFRPPKFARGAEMEARRRKRMQMRTPAAIEAARNAVRGITEEKGAPKPAPVKPLLFVDDTSDEDDDEPAGEGTVEGSMNDSDDADDTGTMPSDFEEVGYLRP